MLKHHHISSQGLISSCVYTRFVGERESKACTSHCLPARNDWMNRALVFYCCLPCSNVLGAQDILLSSLTKTEAVFHCWNSVAMFDAMKHNLACPPPTGPTGIYYIFCTVSLLTFTSHYYWDGVASQKHNHCSKLFSQGFFLVMMTTLMTVRDLKKWRMTFWWLHGINQSNRPDGYGGPHFTETNWPIR